MRSLDDALRVLAGWAEARQPLDRGVLAALATLQQQPTAAGLHKLQAAIAACVERGGPTGASQM